MHHIPFGSSVKCGDTTEVSVAVQVAFLVAGCTHMTYYKALKLVLELMQLANVFMPTIVKMYPVMMQMVDEMCEEWHEEHGSGSAWLSSGIRWGWHMDITPHLSHQSTTDLCQRGRDKVIKEELYQGTSKAAWRLWCSPDLEEGKRGGDAHWGALAGADSSSSNTVTEHFSDAKVMIWLCVHTHTATVLCTCILLCLISLSLSLKRSLGKWNVLEKYVP